AHRRHHTLGLVECVVAQALIELHEHAIDVDDILFRIDLGAELHDDLAVHFNATSGDDLFTLAAASYARVGEHLLQTNAIRRTGVRDSVRRGLADRTRRVVSLWGLGRAQIAAVALLADSFRSLRTAWAASASLATSTALPSGG